LIALTARLLSPDEAHRVLAVLKIDPAIAADAPDGRVTRAGFAMALNICLFADLLRRVPSGAAYVADVAAAGGTVHFDHGALRTILMPDGPTGALPAGEAAFRRILAPLGYSVAGLYPLPRLKMTGRAYAQADHPATIPQFFLSELHVDRFDADFGAAAARVFGSSADPLGDKANALLATFASGGTVSIDEAAAAMPEMVRAFDRQHDRPMLADYEALRAQSAEAAWIATEGNAFNHATDRVADVDALAAAQRALGRPMKDSIEVSATGRVRQTAFRADTVERAFGVAGGADMIRAVPGSFYEFITRDVDPATGTIDLGFDSGNATGIFAMTKAG
jgi:hypothetical protein